MRCNAKWTSIVSQKSKNMVMLSYTDGVGPGVGGVVMMQ
jgi:hypothetical protein